MQLPTESFGKKIICYYIYFLLYLEVRKVRIVFTILQGLGGITHFHTSNLAAFVHKTIHFNVLFGFF